MFCYSLPEMLIDYCIVHCDYDARVVSSYGLLESFRIALPCLILGASDNHYNISHHVNTPYPCFNCATK